MNANDRERLDVRGWRGRWFVEVRIAMPLAPAIYAIGPCGSWSRARRLAKWWEAEHGTNTTRVHATMSGPLKPVRGSGFIPSGVVPGVDTSAADAPSRPAAPRR